MKASKEEIVSDAIAWAHLHGLVCPVATCLQPGL